MQLEMTRTAPSGLGIRILDLIRTETPRGLKRQLRNIEKLHLGDPLAIETYEKYKHLAPGVEYGTGGEDDCFNFVLAVAGTLGGDLRRMINEGVAADGGYFDLVTWGYVIDYDDETYSVMKNAGFAAEFPFDELPSDAEFLEELE